MLYETREQAYLAYRQAPDRFFELYHERWFNEKDLISPGWTWAETKYHYNLVENGIIDLLQQHFPVIAGKSVLDVGAGTGHWIEFYSAYLEAAGITAVDFSRTCISELQTRYAGQSAIKIQHADIARRNEQFTERFEIINAIGVMFHLVDDNQWEAAIGNLVNYLTNDGIAIIGGDFGEETRESGVMRKYRSLRQWETTLEAFGARVEAVKHHDWFKGGVNEGLKNNLMAFVRA
ncbi:MAG: class I SAM-dependent methyltransferase [Thiogranum sp.]|nr:class I SAM-dependent methyltransferase [Thiogranum sp.]